MAGGGDVCPLGWAHHALKASWHRRLFRGRYTPFQGVPAGVNLLLLLAMVGTMVTGGPGPRAVFAFLPNFRWPVLGPAAAHPGLVLGAGFDGPPSGTPLGGHPGPGLAADRSAGAPRCPVGLAFAWPGGGGVWGYAFWYHQLPLYLSAQAHFVFFDAAQPAVGFFLDYLAILGLFVWLAHYGGKGLQALARGKGRRSRIPWRKTAEPLGSAVMPVSDLFACR